MRSVLNLLSGLWGKLLAGLAIVGGVLLVIARLKKAGRDEARIEQAVATSKKRQEMQDANAAGPHTSDDVDKRLSDGKF